ncbi:hypothetical protein ACFFMP_04505 [Pseudoroseomonas cervicalis]|uniref:DUF6414 family protein n=1 Tax=Teichococcus cervicalis TaxID=204525 RepID=UPI0012F4B4C5|nr:hypothetical protein [Pseudoroseomonas cervicalis]
MLKKDGQKSSVEQDRPASLSVYDFLYHDARRIGAFLAQFEASGLLQSVKETRGIEDSETSKAGANAGAKIPALASTAGHFENQAGSVSREAIERHYDPFWTRALSLLTQLQNAGLLERDPWAAELGNVVLVSGSVVLADLSMMKTVWEKSAVRAAIMAGQPTPNLESRAVRKAVNAGRPLNEADLMLQLLPMLPHSPQARILGKDASLWCTLEEEAIVGRASDLILKYGALVSGEWSVVGILDARPYDPEHLTEDGKPLVELLASVVATPIGQMAVRLGTIAQASLGRPPEAFGITPLMIFRELKP